MYKCTYIHNIRIIMIISVSPRINIKGGGVYQSFGQQCSIGVIKQCFSV